MGRGRSDGVAVVGKSVALTGERHIREVADVLPHAGCVPPRLDDGVVVDVQVGGFVQAISARTSVLLDCRNAVVVVLDNVAVNLHVW
jgi:hypothetical protein